MKHQDPSAIFLPGDVLSDFNKGLLNESLCRNWVLRRLHPEGPHCPYCMSEVKVTHLQRFWTEKRIQCGHCKRFFTALTRTFLSGMKLSFSELVLLALFLELHIPNAVAADILDIDPETVRAWKIKFKEFSSIRDNPDKK